MALKYHPGFIRMGIGGMPVSNFLDIADDADHGYVIVLDSQSRLVQVSLSEFDGIHFEFGTR